MLSSHRSFDPLTATAADLQEMLSKRMLTSVDFVERSFAQMDKYDVYLKAIISRAPKAIKVAKKLDIERKHGHVRGPLHGIPILVKDNIVTDARWGMDTTAGSCALKGSRPPDSATLFTRCSQFNAFRGSDLPPGWSAAGGQTQSAYTCGNVERPTLVSGTAYNPGGSSTGSAVGVSAGYAATAIGTDTTGSVNIPSTRAALYGIRVTTGTSDMAGIIPFSARFDTLGVMAKSPLDVANLLEVIVDNAFLPPGGHRNSLSGTWKGLRIGVLSPNKWFIPASFSRPNPGARAQLDRETLAAYYKLHRLGANIQDVDLISWEQLVPSDNYGLFDLFAADFRTDIQTYLANLTDSKVQTLADIVKFNEHHASLELPPGYENQDLSTVTLKNNMSADTYRMLLAKMREVGRELGIDKTLHDNSIDVIIGPADSAFSLLACAAGYPSATFPLSYLDFNGRPFGLFALTSKRMEATLLQVMSAWEKDFPRHPPNLDVER
ncbi:amidase signature enzyme [Cadophora sp. DSE1049]|nr:amidase signature enzyme [Cadophora sp. DSE1049]